MKYRVGNKQSHGMKCYASGGRVSEDISDAGSLPTMSGKSDTSAMSGVDGGKAKSRLDRGGKKGATTVNIVIAGGKPDAGAPAPMPLPPPPMAGPPPAPPMPPGPPMGGPPMLRKNGGRVVKRADGGGVDDPDNALVGAGGSLMASGIRKALRENTAPSMGRKNGGRVNMTAGSGSGLGRLEKIGKK